MLDCWTCADDFSELSVSIFLLMQAIGMSRHMFTSSERNTSPSFGSSQ